MKSFLLLLLLLLVRTSPASAGEPAKLFTDYTAETFQKLDRAQAKIEFASIDFDLLSAAVFHETNQRRANEKLRPLRYNPALRGVARMQAEIMAGRGSISHVNPELPAKKTPLDRLHLAGLQPAFAAENVATAFGLAYRGGDPFYTREELGKKLFSRQPGGAPIAMHTYLSFAQALLDTWMKSPHHRENIVSAEPQFLGISCQPRPGDNGMAMFYCAQVFYTPLGSPTGTR